MRRRHITKEPEKSGPFVPYLWDNKYVREDDGSVERITSQRLKGVDKKGTISPPG